MGRVMKKPKKTLLLFCALGAVLLAALIVWTAWGNTALELNTYTVTSDALPEAFDGYRIAQVSDLHNAEMGEDNEKLLAMLREAEPDIIVITGDLVDSHDTDIEVALRFAEAAVGIAPCYYVTGNHEAALHEADTAAYATLKEGLIQAGVTVPENERVLLERAGQSLSLIGVEDPNFDLSTEDSVAMRETLQTLTGDGEAYTILLSHRPELFDVYVESGVDLVFSGHAHGGQFRFPLIGGLVAPDQGLFPTYDAGIYAEGSTCMVVSRGIGNSIIPFRFNNRPEVVLIELKRAA